MFTESDLEVMRAEAETIKVEDSPAKAETPGK
jgi:hypothetical protein